MSAMRSAIKADEILTLSQLAERLQVPKSWVYEKTRNRGQFGKPPMPVLRCGKYLRFIWPEVEQWLRRQSH
jgi:predicted DNA-binding transcriptional regulator AlpA